MGSDSIPSKTYDLTPKEREIIEWRAQRRLELRNEYLREIHNPRNTIDGHLFDPQLQRQYTAYFSYERIWKPKIKNFLWTTGVLLGSFTAMYYLVMPDRIRMEAKYRNGEISYRDRQNKFG